MLENDTEATNESLLDQAKRRVSDIEYKLSYNSEIMDQYDEVNPSIVANAEAENNQLEQELRELEPFIKHETKRQEMLHKLRSDLGSEQAQPASEITEIDRSYVHQPVDDVSTRIAQNYLQVDIAESEGRISHEKAYELRQQTLLDSILSETPDQALNRLRKETGWK